MCQHAACVSLRATKESPEAELGEAFAILVAASLMWWRKREHARLPLICIALAIAGRRQICAIVVSEAPTKLFAFSQAQAGSLSLKQIYPQSSSSLRRLRRIVID
jgi:hypothetical protein